MLGVGSLSSAVHKDPVVGTNQTGDAMWDRVRVAMNTELLGLPPNSILRTASSYKARWHSISSCCVKFLSIQSAVGASGDNDVTISAKTNHEYAEQEGTAFVYAHCLDALRGMAKIQSLVRAAKDKDAKEAAGRGDAASMTSLLSARPVGRDAARRLERELNEKGIATLNSTLGSLDASFKASIKLQTIKLLPADDPRRVTFIADMLKEE